MYFGARTILSWTKLLPSREDSDNNFSRTPWRSPGHTGPRTT
jgi:hypothetical protein